MNTQRNLKDVKLDALLVNKLKYISMIEGKTLISYLTDELLLHVEIWEEKHHTIPEIK